MLEAKIKEKGIVLFIVLATIFIVILLGRIMMSLISSHARLTHHQVSRIRAYYASLAGVNLAFEKLRTGAWAPGAAPKYYCINDKVDPGVTCLETLTDSLIPYNVQITIYTSQAGINSTTKIDTKTKYTYIP